MKISIIGLGYVGATTAAVLASWGHQVQIFDIDTQKCKSFLNLNPDVDEVGLIELIDANNSSLMHVVGYDEIIQSDIVFICVDTPYRGENLDISRVILVLDQLNESLGAQKNIPEIAIRSTVTPDLDEILKCRYSEHFNSKIFLNPEFLREGSAIDDFNNPPKIVIGCTLAKPASLSKLYAHLDCPKFVMNFRSVTVTKLIDNSWHATKVAFGNELGRILNNLELDHNDTLKPFFADTKLNISANYLRPGSPFGGSCLTKDLSGLVALSSNLGCETPLLRSVKYSNDSHFVHIAKKINSRGCPLKILIFGIAFKAGTNDLRETPSLILGNILREFGHNVFYYDDQLEKFKLSPRNVEVGLSLDENFIEYWVEHGQLDQAYDVIINFRNYLPSYLLHCSNTELKI